MIVLGWIIGIILGILLGIPAVLALAVPIPPLLGTLIAALGGILPPIGFGLAVLFIVLAYLTAYIIGTISIAPGLPAGTTFPLAAGVIPAAPTVVPAGTAELFARGMMFGLSASLNYIALLFSPAPGNLIIASWAFVVISFAIVTAVRTNLIYQGFLGWSAWLFPVSWVATFVGFLLFLINVPFAFAAGGIGAFRIDFTTGVIETNGGLVGITGFAGGFSLGNFNFISPSAITAPTPFTAPGISSHETGHSINTASMGGVVLWINAVDQNFPPIARRNLAYGELAAESRAQAMPTPPVRPRFFILMWV